MGRSVPGPIPVGRVPLALAAAVLVAASGLTACSPEVHPDRADTGSEVDSDVARAVARALDARAGAVRRHDVDAFTAGLARASATFVGRQRDYFDGLALLPVRVFRLAPEPASLVRTGDGYWVVVRQTVQLDGFDDVPVTTRDRYRFVARGGRLLLASVTDPAWERRQHAQVQPWDLEPVDVARGEGVLVVTDAGSAAGPELVTEVEGAVAAVAPAVPYGWDRRVVVYALADPAFLGGLERVPGGDPLDLDAVSFQVVGDTGGEVAATRVVLNPAMVGRPGPARARLLRHELTHVAVGERADGAPTWLSEGIAEYVSVRPLAPEDRAVPAAALAAAEAGPARLPVDADFEGARAEAAYGLAWWACEYVARTYGESLLWTLLDAAGGEGAGAFARVLDDVLGTDDATLARRSAELLAATYGR